MLCRDAAGGRNPRRPAEAAAEGDSDLAFAAIRKQGENAETVYTCYVVESNRLQGVVSARNLLLADPKTPITEIMEDNLVTVKVTDDQEFVAREMQRYDFTAMPVLDNEGMFVGIITIDDAIDVLTDESTEDMQKMAAILPDDDATTYFGTHGCGCGKRRRRVLTAGLFQPDTEKQRPPLRQGQ